MDEFLFNVKERKDEYVCNAMIRYLETMCDLWPIKLRMLKADQTGDWALVDEIKKEIQPVIERAKRPLSEALFWRLKAKELYESNEEFRKKEDDLCSKDFVRFINHWCYTSDPRLPPFGLPSMLPFVLWPKQEEFLLWVDSAYKAGRSWLAAKSRGWGITWLIAAYYVWHWMFHDGFIGGFGSRDKDAVDKIGDPDTIFAKVRYIIYNLPNEMLPASFKGKSIQTSSQDDTYMRVVNYDRETTIRGEGGENIGAGGRASIYTVDEAALVQNPKAIDDSLSYTTNCRGDVSTVRGLNHFGEKLQAKNVRVFMSWFYQDPSKHKNWRENRLPTREGCPFLEHEYLDKGPLVVAQELLIDLNRSVEDSFIPADWVKAAIDFDIPAVGMRQSGFDVSGDGDNKSVYSLRVGPVLYKQKELTFDTMQEDLEAALKLAEDDDSELFSYDADGIGGNIWGHIKFTEKKLRFNLFGVKGNSSASEKYLFPEGIKAKDKYKNKRAENYDNLRERFRKTYEHRKGVRMYDIQELISIPNDPKLVTQLSQPKNKPGKYIQVEGKIEMRSRGVKSPDYCDSAVIAFSDPDRESLVVSSFNYRDNGSIGDFEIDPESPLGYYYVPLVTTGDMLTYALGCLWIPASDAPSLQVFCEFMYPASDVKMIIRDIKEVMCESVKPIREWICNEEMLESLEDNRESPWFMYRKEKVSLRKNYAHDYSTSIMVVNQMFSNGIIKIHKRCEKLMMQLSNWRTENGKPQDGLGFAMALCQLVTRLRTKKEIKAVHIEPNWIPKNPYSGSVGKFGNAAKVDQNAPTPSYMKLAEKQTKNAGENK